MTEADIAFALVAVALSASSSGDAMPLWYNLEIQSHCTGFRCGPLPREQWKVEARRLFQASLARIQVELVNTVRGAVNTVYAAPGYSTHEYEISEEYRGMCSMGKFKSVGWRNVSVWGFSGLLFLAASISLASVQTKEEELWLGVVLHIVAYAASRSFSKMKKMLRKWLWHPVKILALSLWNREKGRRDAIWSLWEQSVVLLRRHCSV